MMKRSLFRSLLLLALLSGYANAQSLDYLSVSQCDANKPNWYEVSRVRDVSDCREFGTDDRANRSESNTFTTHKDLMADPYLFEKVAARNGMTAMRFANQSENRIMDMVQNYVNEKGMVQQATTIPKRTFAGENLPTTKGELEKQSAKTTHKDLMADPYLFEKVAARNGMTAMRFANQSENRIMEMVQNYVNEKGMVQQATTIPKRTFAGENLPTTKGELEKQSSKDRAGISQDIQGVHKKKVAQTRRHPTHFRGVNQ
ncbi:hypothetical protein [Verminephrobacter aporrectodeae]|uniref:hypothetical protein n=1 Tax=Verminephrobacter aporrectodeae TaxID=1110389 RepID=UPI0022370093|nr:hypothetical protein [Verminephrobacter aporrectodeae]